MRARFTDAQLAEPEFRDSAAAIRRCVHCGFCTATCPTYLLTGDERDGPRGRIELIRAMIESDGPPSRTTVTHLDRCLSCLGCKTTCPSGVDYARLIDHARVHIEATYRRPWPARALRWALAAVLTRPPRLRIALALGRLARPLAPVAKGLRLAGLAALLRLVPDAPGPVPSRPVRPIAGARGRVVLLTGCVEPVLAPQVRAAAVRLLNLAGYEVADAPGEGCCGALSAHLGRSAEAKGLARANLDAWADVGPIAAVVTTAAGCGTQIKGYDHLLPGDPRAASAAGLARDLMEFLAEVGLPAPSHPQRLAVAYHGPCSLQHGQGVRGAPERLLAEAGFEVRPVRENHICCGSAGIYNVLQPRLAGALRDRKSANIDAAGAQVVSASNIGCIAQLQPALVTPICHPAELLDWAHGRPAPAALKLRR